MGTEPRSPSSLIRANGLEVVSAAQCQHVHSIASERLAEPFGNVGSQAVNQMREVLADLLDP